MKKLLVTGASGFLGWQVCQHLPPDWQAIGTWNQSKNGIFPNTLSHQIDLRERDQIWRMLKETKPDALFHLAAISGTGACEKAPEISFPINVEATAHLAEMCAERKVKFLFTSSEQVFDGHAGNYAENAVPHPKNEYGKQKLEAEKRIRAMGTEAIIVRIAVLFGKGSPSSKSFLGQWLGQWEKHLPVTAFHDETRSFLSGKTAADGLFHLLRQDASGLFHLGGKEAVSRTEFAEMAAAAFGLSNAEIKSVSQKEIDMAAFRPPDLSLDCGKIEGTGFLRNGLGTELEWVASG